MSRQKSKFPKGNGTKHQQRQSMVNSLLTGHTYGRGHNAFHLPKGELLKMKHPSRYTEDHSNKGWLKQR